MDKPLDGPLASLKDAAVGDFLRKAASVPRSQIGTLPKEIAHQYAEMLSQITSRPGAGVESDLSVCLEYELKKNYPRVFRTNGYGPYCAECFYDGRSGPGHHVESRVYKSQNGVCQACAKHVGHD